MKALIILVMTSMMGLSAFANDFAAVVGFRSNSADLATASTASIESKTGFGAGIMGFFDVGENVQMRTGFLYNQRNVGYSVSGVDVDLNLAYMDIPVTVMYKFADYGGAFIGPVLGLLASKECKVSGGICPTSSPESTLMALQFGASFKFAPQMGAELYYEMIPSEYWKSALKNGRTVGVNLLITFE